MARVVLHKLRGSKKAQDACRLVEMLVDADRRVVVWVAEEGRAKVLDDYLWTFSQSSFVPHGLASPGAASDDPVVIVSGQLDNPNRADTLVIVDRLDDVSKAASFDEIHDLDAGTEEDVGKKDTWSAGGYEVIEEAGVSRPG